MTEKQKSIYTSALEIFAQKGFSGASTGEIAKKAGVAEGLIFKHYKSKKNLFLKIAFMVVDKTLFPQTVIRTKNIFSESYSDIRVFLIDFYRERLDFIKKHISFLKIILQETSIDPELLNFMREKFGQTMLPIVREFIIRHQKSGVLRQMDPDVMIRMFISSFLGYAVLRFIVMPAQTWDDEAQIKQTVDILCQGLNLL